MSTNRTHRDVVNPGDDHGRRGAVVMALGRAPALIRYALRFSVSLADAEDAYQRAMEIALTKGPDLVDDDFMAWLHTVIRREALRIKETYQREQPHGDEEIMSLAGSTISSREDTDPHRVYAWRERYRAIQDALSGLTDSQQTCLMLRSAGASHQEIEDITGYSARKIERAIVEARRRVREFELRVESGSACRPMADLITRVLDAEASGSERRRLSLHVRHCGGCRAEFRERRDQARLLSSLVPGLLLVPSIMESLPPDPSVALSWWERVTQGAQFRAGQATQLWLDVPSLLTTRTGAGAAAVAVAGAIGTPMVVDAVRTDASSPRPIVAPASASSSVPSASVQPTRIATATTPSPAAVRRTPSSVRATITPKRPVTAIRPAVKRAATSPRRDVPPAATRTWVRPTTQTASTGVSSTRSSAVRSSAPRGSAETEFSP